MIPEELQKKLAELREEYEGEDNQSEISAREKRCMDKIKDSNLASVDGVKEIIKDALGRVHDINVILAYDELSELDRAKYQTQRDFFEMYILRRFGAYKVEDALAELEKYVDEKLAL